MSDDLTQIPTDELIQNIQDDLYDGIVASVEAGTHELLRRGLTPTEVMNQALVGGMDIVGVDFRDGILFVPEVLMAAKAMKAGMEILRPLLANTGAQQIGTMIVGTVKGDIHDIGKDIVNFMLDVNGFQVKDLGVDVPVEKFVEEIKAYKPDVVALSGFLTLAYTSMKETVEAITAAGLRQQVKIMIGGGTMDQQICAYAGADAFGKDAMAAVALAKTWTGAK